MKRSSKPLPIDSNQRAYAVFKMSIEESERPEPGRAAREYLAKIGRLGGKRGGPARAAKLTQEQRHEIASNAAKARWSRKPQS
jgi:hypothetical protein